MRRRYVFWPLLAAFTAASIAWLFYVPRQPGQLYRAIPASATVLSAHRDLQGRWNRIASHPLVLEMAGNLGADRNALAGIQADKPFQRILGLIGSEELLLAHVPLMRSTGEPAWVFAAWLGGHSQRMRWLLKSTKSPELQRAATRHGWLVWVWTPPELKGQRVTFALVEGMLVGCVASGTMGIDDILGGVDGHLATLADRPELQRPQADVPDRGWFRNARGDLFPFAVELDDGRGLRATVETPWRLPPPAAGDPGTVALDLDGFSHLVGSRAVVAAAVEPGLVRHGLAGFFTNAVSREIADLIGISAGSGPVAIGVLGGDYSGRFMAVRLPTVVATVAGSPVAQHRSVRAALDRLNAITRWGLVAAPSQVGAAPLYAIESTGGGVYAEMEREELLAYTPTDDGLVFASNLATLERLLRERGAVSNRVAGAWSAGLGTMQEGRRRGFVWLDAAEGARVVRLGVTAWSLKLLLENPQGSQPTRQRLNEYKAWMDAVAPLGQVRVALDERNGQAVFTLEAGGP